MNVVEDSWIESSLSYLSDRLVGLAKVSGMNKTSKIMPGVQVTIGLGFFYIQVI